MHGSKLIPLALALCVAAVEPTTARAEVLERVVAVVDGEPIFLSQLRLRASPLLYDRSGRLPRDTQAARTRRIYTRVLRDMIDELLLEDAAESEGLVIGSRQLERVIDNVRRQSGLTRADFWEAVERQGFSPAEYRAEVRRQLLRLEVSGRGRGPRLSMRWRAVLDELRREAVIEWRL